MTKKTPSPITPPRISPQQIPGSARAPKVSLHQSVIALLGSYFSNWKSDKEPFGVMRMLKREVEPAALAATLKYTNGNKARAARILGINRGSLDSKLRSYGMSTQWKQK